jgi:hypothetical protein
MLNATAVRRDSAAKGQAAQPTQEIEFHAAAIVDTRAVAPRLDEVGADLLARSGGDEERSV